MSSSHSAEARGFDAELVIRRLEEAGAALLALPGSGWSTRLRGSSLEIVRTAMESYGWTTKRIRPPIPSAERITRMDEALAWIPVFFYVGPLNPWTILSEQKNPWARTFLRIRTISERL